MDYLFYDVVQIIQYPMDNIRRIIHGYFWVKYREANFQFFLFRVPRVPRLINHFPEFPFYIVQSTADLEHFRAKLPITKNGNSGKWLISRGTHGTFFEVMLFCVD